MSLDLSQLNNNANLLKPKDWPVVSYLDALALMGGTLPKDGHHNRFWAWQTEVTETFSVYSHVAY